MKRFFLFFLASVILVGCSDDPSLILAEALKREAREKQEQSVQPGIEFRSEFDAAPVVPGESAETPVYFKSNLEWKAETTSSWFSISPKSGKSGDGSVVIKTQANEEFDTRSGKITFTSGYKTFTITVVQSPKSAIILEKDSFEVGKDGGTVTVVARTTVGFETVVPSDYSGWIGVEPYTKALETRYVQLNIAKNDGPERAGYVDLVNKEKGLSKRVSIKQDAGGIEVTGVSLDKTELTITVGDPGVKLVATVTPDNATDKTVSWSSDNEAVATVDNQGNVHAVEIGTANITVTTTDGSKTATCTVTVTRPVTFKAVYNTNGGANTLTFYYDANDHSGEGITVYEDGTDKFLFDDTKNNGAKWGYNSNRGEIKSVEIDASVAGYKGLTSTAYMFQSMTTATNISGAEYLDVSNVTDMNSMFESYGESSNNLNKVPDVSGWKTGKVTSMTSMFNNYGNNSTVLADVPDVSNWNTSNVTDMADMFNEYGRKSTVLNTVPDVSGWNTSNVTKISNLFNDYGLASHNIDCTLDLSGWDLSKITGNNGENVFNFNPSTFNITIPAKTGDKSNEGGKWCYGDGTNSIAAPAGKTFTPTLAGVFSVSATKKVRFSQGNLYWDGDSFELETNQYDVQSSWSTSHVSHFFWSKDASVAYAASYSESGTATTDVFFTNDPTDAEKAKADFTVNGVTGKYRTLSKDEWKYLFEDRTGAANKHGFATVGGVYGIIILPDTFTDPMKNGGSGAFKPLPIQGYDANVYAIGGNWEAMESAGAVFLPATNFRKGTNFDQWCSGSGFYWSSVVRNASRVYGVTFNDGTVYPQNSDHERNCGKSVRLVTEVPASASTIESFNMKEDDSSNWN